MGDAEDARALVRLLERWRDRSAGGGPELVAVRSDAVVPDGTNRERTGLSVEHVHYVATLVQRQGFRRRSADGAEGHDIPVLVREAGPPSAQGVAALKRWRETTAENTAFPPCRVADGAECFYTSLGSGHFSQALNLFREPCGSSIYTGERYDVGDDAALRDALEHGVPSVVLRNDMPAAERKVASLLLNSTHMQRFGVDPSDGQLVVLRGDTAGLPAPSQFERLSKTLDAEELSALVRIKLGVDVDSAKTRYKARL